MTGTLAGRTALVTGGRGGIGEAICRRFVAEGARVFAAGRRDRDEVTAGEFLPLDVTAEQVVADAIAHIEATAGGLDIVVNAAGIEIEKTIEDTSLSEWNEIFAVNVTGTYLVSKHALALLRHSDVASIVNIGSYDGEIADPKLAAYCATKGAVHALTKAMAVDHGPDGIRVNAICPGYIDTPMLDRFLGDEAGATAARDAAAAIHPVGAIGSPDDVAGLALWLASDEARYATGQLWILDGGLTAQVQQMRP